MKRHSTIALLCLLFIAVCQTACTKDIVETTGDIIGHVYDSHDNSPITHASIQIVPHNKTFTTGEDGYFFFPDLESREYEVTVSKDGYNTQKKNIFVEIGKENRLDFQIQPSQPELTVSENTLDFGNTSTTQTFSITNTGNALLEWQISEDIPWLSCLPTSGEIEAGSSQSVIANIDRSGLEKGNYSQTIAIASNGGSAVIEANLSVQGNKISINPKELDFGSVANSLPLTLQNIGSGIVSYTIDVSNEWIIPSKSSGQLANIESIIVSVNRNTMSQGDYTGTLSINFDKEKEQIPIKMNIPEKSQPVVSIHDICNVTYNSATAKGAIVSIGSSRVTQYGFCWSINENPSVNDEFCNLGDSETAKDITYNISGLEPKTTYYVRAYAKNAVGISYSSQMTLQTKDTPQKPVVETGSASHIQSTTAEITGNILNIGEEKGLTMYGHVWGEKEMPSIENGKCTDLGRTDKSGAYSSTLKNLKPNTKYYARAYASNTIGTSYGEEITFTTSLDSVKLTTANAYEITHNCATAGGTITADGGHTITERGVCWSTSAAPTISGNSKASADKSNTFTVRIEGLQQKTSYHLRAYAKTQSNKIFYGNDITFATVHEIKLPEVGNVTVTEIGVSKATFSSTITSDGEGNISDCGFCYSVSPNPTINDNRASYGPGTSTFGKSVSRLSENTTYYVRAYATNEAGTNYSSETAFTTKEVTAASLSDVTVSSVNFTSANVEAQITDNGNGTVTDAGFCYSGEHYPTLQSGTKVSCGKETSLKAKITGLEPEHTYYLRAYAINEKGTSYSNEVTITTPKHEVNPYTTILVETSYGTAEINMAKVVGGTFIMGAQKTSAAKENYDKDAYSDESPTHSVTLSSYYISNTTVTQKLWYVVTGNYPAVSNSYGLGDDYPVYNVSYSDCQQFINMLNNITGKNFRMPTEAEWEFAARGGNNSSSTKWSGSGTCGASAWHAQNSGGRLHPVAQKQPNELNIYDMSGNVWEWCSDWYGNYSSSAQTNPAGAASGTGRVIRGGGYDDTATDCRVTVRSSAQPSGTYTNIGLRLVFLK